MSQLPRDPAEGAPLTPHARVRVVCLGRDAECWRVEGDDGAALCQVQLSITTRGARNSYQILTPDVPPGYLSPRLLCDGTFTRGTAWWTPEVLRAVLKDIVRTCVAPAAEVTMEGVPPC